MTDVLLRMLCGATLGLALVLLLRRPARRVFGAGAAFTLWLLPLVLALAPLLPEQVAPRAMIVVPGLTVTPHFAAAARPAAIDWTQGLVVVWLVGAAGALLRLAMHYVYLLRNVRRVPEAWKGMLAEAAATLDPCRVRVHAAGPAVLWALPHSLVLLPADFPERFDNPATRELVLRHELTHVRRGDALWSLAMELATALLWFHPLAWLARSRFRLDQELACDAAALRAMPQRTAGYARALVASIAARPAPALIPWLAEPQLKERIAMISRIPPGALRRRAGFLAVATLLALGMYVAGGQKTVRAAAPVPSGAAPPSVDATYKQEHPPRYPVEAIGKGEQGVVMLDVTVDASGKVTNIKVDPKGTTAAATLQNAAIQAAQNWKFDPGEKDGHPAGGVVRIPVTFSLMSWKSTALHPCPPTYHYQEGSFDGNAYKCVAEGPATPSSVLVHTN
jgi:TonB family protein